MKDYLKNKLEINDTVVFIEPGYRNYKVGTITRFTKHFAFIKYKNGSTWDKSDLKQKGYQLIKVPPSI